MNKIAPTTTDTRPLFAQLLHTVGVVQSRVEQSLDPAGLSLPQLRMLYQVFAVGRPLPLSELAERMFCGRSNMTQLADRLEAEGLLRRVPDPEDRRVVLAELTEEGRRRVQEGARAAFETQELLLTGLDEEDRANLSRMLAIIRENAE